MSPIANTDQFDAWNGDSGTRWVRDAARRDRIHQPVADAVLTAAGLHAGGHVLDLGCGCGATTLAAARLVAPTGTATGIDLSEPMLAVARRRMEGAGATNVAWIGGDAQTHPFDADSYDVAISRFGTMFFAEPTAAFANVATGLRAGGRLCLATWRPFDANAWLTIPGAVLARYAPARAPGPGPAAASPLMFSQSDPDAVTTMLADAGYTAVSLERLDVALTVGTDPDDALGYLADTAIGRAALAAIPEPDRPEALAAVRAALADHTTDQGVRLGAALWVVTAARR
jgi:SAM-dependent methyltransferase